jgi:hypothetical protein
MALSLGQGKLTGEAMGPSSGTEKLFENLMLPTHGHSRTSMDWADYDEMKL